MYTRTSAIEYTLKFLQECRKLPVKIDKAILFGSVIKNKNHEDSDIDLALFSNSFTQNILDNLDLIGLVNIHYPEIDVHTFATKDFDLSESPLLYEIKTTGIEIKS